MWVEEVEVEVEVEVSGVRELARTWKKSEPAEGLHSLERSEIAVGRRSGGRLIIRWHGRCGECGRSRRC